MLLWAAILGAAIGWCLLDFESYGLLAGGAVGLIGGWGLRRAIRSEVAAAIQSSSRAEPAAMPEARMLKIPLPLPAARPSEARPEPAPPPPTPPKPDELGILAVAASAAVATARAWLLGGNTIVRAGLVVLFVGLSFLASYAASAGLFPIEMRLAVVAAIGIVLLGVGYRTRSKRPEFGLALQGGGIAIVYLTLFAAARLFDTLPLAPAFAMMVVVCALGCVLALLQQSQALAATSFAGGFAVPLLVGANGGAVGIVFAYDTILNVAIMVIAARRAWRVLDLIGLSATFGMATLWMATGYRLADFAVTQAFVAASVLIYLSTAMLYTRAAPGRLGNVVDTTLLFGPAFAGFGLEVALLHGRPFGSAFAALGFAALYLGAAAAAMRRRQEGLRTMVEAMLAIGVGFVTLAVPLALGARWTSAAWALEGAGAVWIGLRQARWLPRLIGLALQLVAALIYLGTLGWTNSSLPIANAGFVGAIMIAGAALATAWWLRAPPSGQSRLAAAWARAEARLVEPVFLAGFGFWWLAWAGEATRRLPPLELAANPSPVFAAGTQILLVMLAGVASAWLFDWIGQRMRWPVATWPSHVTLAALVVGFAAAIGAGEHVLYTPAWLLWTSAVAIHLWLLHRNDVSAPPTGDRATLQHLNHVGGVWLGVVILTDCVWLGIDRGGLWRTSWAETAFLASLVAVLIGLTTWSAPALRERTLARRWPPDRHAFAYGWHAALPVAALVYLGALGVALLSSGETGPLPYLPLLNPVDLVLALALAALAMWRGAILAADPPPPGSLMLRGAGATAALVGLGFVLVNSVWLRAAHHLLDIPWQAAALLANAVVQTGIALLWALLALAMMALAHRRSERTVWLTGAGLLGLTVAKLILVDLNAAGGAARIVAFIAVGLLMLVVGYLAPLPPKVGATDKMRTDRTLT